MTSSPSGVLVPLLRRYLAPYRSTIGVLLLFQCVQAIGMLYLPTLNADIVDHGVLTSDTGYVVGRGGVMVAVTLGQVLFACVAIYLGARVAMAVGRDLRAAAFHKVNTLSVREVQELGAPSLITRTTNDVQQIQMVVLFIFTMSAPAPFLAVGGLTLAWLQDVPLFLVLMAALPIKIFVVSLLIRAMTPASRAMQARIDGINRVMREQIAGIRVIRAFVRDRDEQRRFAAANADLRTMALKMGHITAFFGATAMLISNLAAITVVWLGGYRIDAGAIEVGTLIAFLGYVTLTLTSVMLAMAVVVQAPRARVSAERLQEVLDTETSVPEPASPLMALPGLNGHHPAPVELHGGGGNGSSGNPGAGVAPVELRFRNVSFRYPGADDPVLQGVDLEARPGKVTAIVGSTASGKTTLVNLTARLYDTSEGTVEINGVDVRRLHRDVLTTAVGLVPQKAHLFTGTVASNLRFGNPDAGDGDLWHALEIAQASGFVASMPDGLDTRVGQGGTTVSGGQRQRLAIARALLARPRIYVFDDAFSALDTATDATLRAALADEIQGATQVVVAQRVATIRDADTIVVLDQGRVVGSGTHDQLLAGCSTYGEIVRSQITGSAELEGVG